MDHTSKEQLPCALVITTRFQIIIIRLQLKKASFRSSTYLLRQNLTAPYNMAALTSVESAAKAIVVTSK